MKYNEWKDTNYFTLQDKCIIELGEEFKAYCHAEYIQEEGTGVLV